MIDSSQAEYVPQVTPQDRTGIEPEGEILSSAVRELFDDAFGPGAGLAHQTRYPWQYRHGGTGEGSRLNVFWHKGQAIGSLGALPCTLFVDGEALPAKFTADLCSSQAWRNRGIGARLMQQFVRESGLSLAFAVSPDARTLLLRMGFQEAPLKVYFRVLRLEGLADRRLHAPMRDARLAPVMREALRLTDASQPLWSPLVSAGRALLEAHSPLGARLQHSAANLRACLPSIGRQRVEVETVARFPGCMDILEAPLSQQYPVALLPDSAALNRRYADHPSHNYLLQLAWRRGLPVGYAVWRVFQEDHLRMAHLSTLVAAPTDSACLDALLQHGLQRMYEAGAYAVKAIGSPLALADALERQLFFPRGESPGLYFYCPTAEKAMPNAQTLQARLAQPWLIGLGASDADI